VRQSAGELDAEPRLKIVRETLQADSRSARPGETVIELFDRWAAYLLAKGDKRTDTVNQDRKVMEQFAKFVGADRDVRSITAIEVADYRDTLRRLPPKWMVKKELAGLDMRAAAETATASNKINTPIQTIGGACPRLICIVMTLLSAVRF
jgi:hypothetical protein